MPHFLEDFTIVSLLTRCQEFFTHSQTLGIEGRFTLPAGVTWWVAASVHFAHSSCTNPLNGLLTETSRGCNWLVNPPRITVRRVFSLVASLFVDSVTCALKWSHTNKDGLLRRPPGRLDTYPRRIRRRSNLGHFFGECVLWARKYGSLILPNVTTVKMLYFLFPSINFELWCQSFHCHVQLTGPILCSTQLCCAKDTVETFLTSCDPVYWRELL